jgi:hypothetical protein
MSHFFLYQGRWNTCILCIGADGIKNLGNFVFIFLIDLFDPQDKIDLSLFKVNFNLFAIYSV